MDDEHDLPPIEEVERLAREIEMPWLTPEAISDFAKFPDFHGPLEGWHK